MDLAPVVAALRGEAERTNERRVLVLAGGRDAGYDAVERALAAAGIDWTDATLLGPDDRLPCERLTQRRAGDLLGTTREAVVVDCHDCLRPNALGRVVGAVDGGGLLVLLFPDLDDWGTRRGDFEAGLAVPPFDADQVTTRFRERVVRTLRAHRGIAVVDLDDERVVRDGRTDPAPRRPVSPVEPPDDAAFPASVYRACLTDDQANAVAELERLRRGAGDAPRAVVVEADRGRGKSAAAGLAAACLARESEDVLVTAPGYRNAREVFVRARAFLRSTGDLDDGTTDAGENPQVVATTGGGRVRFASPPDAATAVTGGQSGHDVESADPPDVLVVDEAAALPVRVLESFLAADRVAFATTVHGYEGTGRGFDVRFRDRLAESDHAVTDVTMAAPIRYAPGDPVEVWAFRTLLLDARPAVDPLVSDATPDTVTYRQVDRATLVTDEHRLRETFGLLVTAHYRTDPNDLGRLLDAPNITVRALRHDGHVVSVALLAREGGLSADIRADMYEGGRVKGNMLPDVLTSQLRDEGAGEAVGWRVMRIATHPAVRSRGLGSHLLDRIRDEATADDAGPDVALDWLGVGYGATPELLSFWADNGFGTVHLSTTRNDTSGEYSALMLDPLTPAGESLHDCHAAWFARRAAGVLGDPLADLDPDVARAALRACDATVAVDLPPEEWRVLAGAAYGPGLFDVDPGAFARLAVAHLVDPADADALTARQERLLVLKPLQGRPWDRVADRLGFHSTRECMRALGDALRPLVDAYGDETARRVRDRFDGD